MSIDSSIQADADADAAEAPEAPEAANYDHHGFPVYSYDGQEYAVAETEDAIREAAEDAIRETLWALNAEFIANYIPNIDKQGIDAIRAMQEKLCESANPIVEALLGDSLEDAIDAAIDADGLGHFLSGYDGTIHDGVDICPEWEGRYVFRV